MNRRSESNMSEQESKKTMISGWECLKSRFLAKLNRRNVSSMADNNQTDKGTPTEKNGTGQSNGNEDKTKPTESCGAEQEDKKGVKGELTDNCGAGKSNGNEDKTNKKKNNKKTKKKSGIDKKIHNELNLPLLISIAPAVIITIADNIINNIWELSVLNKILIYLLCYICVIFIIRFFYFRAIKKRRDELYNRYVGKWIQYIPEFSRKISVCSIEYQGDYFLFSGYNYDEKDGKVKFYARMYLDEYLEGYYARFHYKTDAHVVEKYNERVSGFGELEIYGTEATGLYTGDGYFYDVLSSVGKGKGDSIQFDPIQLYSIVKFDEKFYKRLQEGEEVIDTLDDVTIKRMTFDQVYNKVRDLFTNLDKKRSMPSEGAFSAIKKHFDMEEHNPNNNPETETEG